MPLAEEAVAATVGKRMAVAGEAEAHLAIAGDLDAILLARSKLAGLLGNWTASAIHGTVILALAGHTGKPSTLASHLDHHVKVHVGLLVAPMGTEHIAHLDLRLWTVNHSHVVGLDVATTAQVLAIDADVVALAADVGDLVHVVGRQSVTVGESAVPLDGHVDLDESALANRLESRVHIDKGMLAGWLAVSSSDLTQRHFVADTDHTDTVAVDVLERAADGGGVFAVEQGFLGLGESLGDSHEKAVLESGVVGVEADVDDHCANSIQDATGRVNRYFAKNAGLFVARIFGNIFGFADW